ncbi:alpha/beta hydrolase [Deinococcus misasensis]|uniref:alpha/beta hydrolase n=1 Tax=Deinococcus misasensis TaxID=392413 RepID=UPI0005582D39|nr:alpha/beta hydrolase [Deinococcus misasensis]
MKIKLLLATALLTLPLVAQAQNRDLNLLNTLTVTRDLQVQHNIPYGTESRQKLDIYLPRQKGTHPVVVFVHGGSWQSYSKDNFEFVGESFARAGYVTVLVNYRLAPQFTYPAFVQDTVKAFKWVKDNIQQHSGNPNEVFVMGHSAGAYNVAEAIINQDLLSAEGLKPTDFKGVIGIAGPYDFDPAFTPGVFGTYLREQAMPANHVKGELPPFLLLVAQNDELVAPENATSMKKALKANGTPVELVTIPRVNHGEILGALMRRLSGFFPPVRQTVLDFMKKNL